MTQGLKTMICDLVDTWNRYDIHRVSEYYAPDYTGTDIGQSTPRQGPQAVQESIERFRDAFPDLHIQIDQLIIEGDCAALFWTAQGTHKGHIMNIPPTGKNVRVGGATFFVVKAGKIYSGYTVWDMAGFLRSIGLLPDL